MRRLWVLCPVVVALSASPAMAASIAIHDGPCSPPSGTTFCFNPPSQAVASGEQVTWTNQSAAAPHQIVRCTPSACAGNGGGTGGDGWAGSGVLNPGGTYSHTFTGAGTYVYYCPIHGYLAMHGTIIVTSPPPVVTSTNPANGATGVAADANADAVFSRAMDEPSTAQAFSLTDDSRGQPVAGSVSWFGDTVPVFTPAGGFLRPGDRYTAVISAQAKSADGVPLAATVSWSFAVSPDPIVERVAPVPGATGVFPNAPVDEVFSQPMNEQATQAAFSLTDPGGHRVAGSFSWFGPTVMIFTPSSDLLPGAKYAAAESTAAKDQSGNPLAAAKSWSFTTTNDPVIDAVSPKAGATEVPPTSVVDVVFSEPMNEPVTAAAFSVTSSSTGVSVPGSVVWFGPRVAVFQPSSPLASNTGYTASVGAGARDPSGHSLADPTTWTFTTGPIG
jgi:plastocyanin